MRLAGDAGQVHLTYCLNIHAGETWAEHRESIRTSACRVRDLVAWPGDFGLGLRLGARAAAELDEAGRLREVAQWLAAQRLYAFTINGFPYGTFHGTRVKEQVYAPDWTQAARVEYTLRLGRILAALLPEGVPGSISTVPGTYRAWAGPGVRARILANLVTVVAALSRLEAETGRMVCLALEPEPDCLWDQVEQVMEWFHHDLLTHGVTLLAAQVGSSRETAAQALRRHLGVCLDTCHQSVLYDDPGLALTRLLESGVAVPKIQISAAPVFETTAAGLDRARGFIDPCYLHQSCLSTRTGLRQRYADLPEAIAAAGGMPEASELRTHFHIPLVLDAGAGFRSTRAELSRPFWRLAGSGRVPHLEVETYSFGVLPPELRQVSVEASLAGELAWVQRALAEARAPGAGAVL